MDQPEGPTKMDKFTAQKLQGTDTVVKESREELARRVTEAKKKAPDKEPFNINGFGQHYDLTDDSGERNIGDNVREKFEADYYLNHPDIKSLADYAKKRLEKDSHNAG